MKNDEKEGMGRVIYSVSPDPPKGDKLEKETNLPLLTYSAIARQILSCHWLSSKGECDDGEAKK